MKDSIQIKGARVNNLKNISLEIPRRKLIVNGTERQRKEFAGL